jgi:hypothetical protein
VLEVEAVRGGLKIRGGHAWPAFKRRNFAAIDNSTLRLPIRLHMPSVGADDGRALRLTLQRGCW